MSRAPLYLYVRDPIDGDHVIAVRSTSQIGRELTCEVVVGDAEASRRHAELAATGDGWQVRDLGSTNGTYVNDRRVVGTVDVAAGDVIRIGRVSVELHATDPTPADSTRA